MECGTVPQLQGNESIENPKENAKMFCWISDRVSGVKDFYKAICLY